MTLQLPGPARVALLVAGLLGIGAAVAEGQTVIKVCHNNRTGVLYVIDPSGTSELPTSCVNPNHLMLAVTDAAGADHGDLTGLLDNDHPQYVQRAAPVNGDLTNTYDVPLIGLSKVRTQHLRDFAVTGPKIADGAVTTTKFGPKAVWRGNIALGRSIAA